jgi:hypothetical protein
MKLWPAACCLFLSINSHTNQYMNEVTSLKPPGMENGNTKKSINLFAAFAVVLVSRIVRYCFYNSSSVIAAPINRNGTDKLFARQQDNTKDSLGKCRWRGTFHLIPSDPRVLRTKCLEKMVVIHTPEKRNAPGTPTKLPAEFPTSYHLPAKVQPLMTLIENLVIMLLQNLPL